MLVAPARRSVGARRSRHERARVRKTAGRRRGGHPDAASSLHPPRLCASGGSTTMVAHRAGRFALPAPPDCSDLAAQAADYLPPPLDPEELEGLLARLDGSDHVATRAVLALVRPESACPGCVRDAGIPWPAGATSRSCAFHTLEYAHQWTRRRRERREGATDGAPLRPAGSAAAASLPRSSASHGT